VVTLAEAYAECERQARSHYENFPVASVFVPREMRPHIAAIYAFARTADDIADEGDAGAGERVARLDTWLRGLHDAVAGHSTARTPEAGPAALVALAASIRALGLPVTLFDDLVSAFKQDAVTTRYETWADVLDYCRRSANPVGRLVLRVAGVADETLDRQSDAVCTALQLTNFWQDLARDWQKGRVYVPRADLARFGAGEGDLAARRWTPAWQATMAEMAGRTSELFDSGRPVCDGLPGRLRLELRFTWLGGKRILERLESAGFDVFAHRPTLGAGDVPALLWQAMTWRRS
jgi:squalene synthase HpnC